MNEIINRIYELKYSTLTTPSNLLNNARLENYEYVKYYQKGTDLVVEMKCFNGKENGTFFYHFDSNDKLIYIYMVDSSDIKTLKFSREIELEKIIEEYNLNKKDTIAS